VVVEYLEGNSALKYLEIGVRNWGHERSLFVVRPGNLDVESKDPQERDQQQAIVSPANKANNTQAKANTIKSVPSP